MNEIKIGDTVRLKANPTVIGKADCWCHHTTKPSSLFVELFENSASVLALADAWELVPEPIAVGSWVRHKQDHQRTGTVRRERMEMRRFETQADEQQLRIQLHNTIGVMQNGWASDWELDPAAPFQPGDKVRNKQAPQFTGTVISSQQRQIRVAPDGLKVIMLLAKNEEWEKIPKPLAPEEETNDIAGLRTESEIKAKNVTEKPAPEVNPCTGENFCCVTHQPEVCGGWVKITDRLPDKYPCEVTNGKEIVRADRGWRGYIGVPPKNGWPGVSGWRAQQDLSLTHWRPLPETKAPAVPAPVSTEDRLKRAVKILKDYQIAARDQRCGLLHGDEFLAEIEKCLPNIYHAK